MTINPIIPIWLMMIICVVLLVILVADLLKFFRKSKQKRPQKIVKYKVFNFISKTIIVAILFVINLRIMVPNGDATQIKYDVDILFVIDRSVSMRALDYSGENERMEGVISDCCYIVDTLNGANYSIITFGDTAKRAIPFTSDADMVKSQLKVIDTENDTHATGTTMNPVKDVMEEVFKSQQKNKGNGAKTIVFFVSDGEITMENEKLEAFSNLKKYILGGAVMGYGTTSGGKMVRSLYNEGYGSESEKYVYYYDSKYKKIEGVSKIDESNLKSIASDLGLEYVHMTQKSKIDNVLSSMKKQLNESQTTEKKIESYQDTYYYFAVAIAICFFVDFIVRKRSLQ